VVGNLDERGGDPFGDPWDGLSLREQPSGDEPDEDPRTAPQKSPGWSLPASTAQRPPDPARRSGSASGGGLRTWLVLGALVAALVAAVAAGGLAGRPQDEAAEWHLASPLRLALGDGGRPSPQRAVSAERLGVPRLPPSHAGPHEFMAYQSDGVTPVAYDPCRPIPYVINPRTAPPGAEALVAQAVQRIAEITGLQFELEGTTDEPANPERGAFQPDRYGDRWAPVLIAWSDPGELPVLDGEVVGIGGSTAIEAGPRSHLVYVTGMVALDGPQLAGIASGANGRAYVQGVILHELGHLLGLDHVDDPRQLMHARGRFAHPQSGDVTGLVRLGGGPCFDRL
jgi:hypothetical protein